MADPTKGTPQADPDGDGVANLAEFALGGNPRVADASVLALRPAASPTGGFIINFRARKNPGDVEYRFESSTNLVAWTEVTPSSVMTMGELPVVYLLAATFPALDQGGFFRLKFLLAPSP